MKRILVLTAALTVVTVAPRAQTATELGTINFPTSAKPAAQAPFLVGTKALYNFEFDIAAEAFQQSGHDSFIAPAKSLRPPNIGASRLMARANTHVPTNAIT